MKKTINLLFLMLFGLGLFVSSCDKDVIEKRVAHFSIDATYFSEGLELNVSGDSIHLSVTTNTFWEVKTDEDANWISISPKKGTGDNLVKIKVGSNPDVYPRTTMLHFQSYEISDSLKVVQKGNGIALSQNEFTEISADKNNFTVKVNSSQNWKTISSETAMWFHLDKVEGEEGESDLVLTVDENLGIEARKDSILFLTKDELSKQWLTISQLNSSPKIEASTAITSFTAEAGSFIVKLNSNIEWETNTTLEGLVVSPINAEDSTVSVSYPENILTEEISFNLVFQGKDPFQKIKQVLNFKQQGVGAPEIILTIDNDLFDNIDVEGGNFKSELNATRDWKSVNSLTGNWISLNPVLGKLGTSELTFTVEPNRTEVIRKDSILLISTDDDISSKIWVKFIQNAFIPVLSATSNTKALTSAKGTFSIQLEANVDWIASSNIEGVIVDPVEGEGDVLVQDLEIYYPANEETETRDIIIDITAKTPFEKLTKKIKLTQEGAQAVNIVVLSSEISIDGRSQLFNIELSSSNVDWLAVSQNSQFKIIENEQGVASGSPSLIKVNVSANNSLFPIKGIIEIQQKDKPEFKTSVSITQGVHPMNGENFLYENANLTALELGLDQNVVHPTQEGWKFWNAHEFTSNSLGFWNFNTKVGIKNAILDGTKKTIVDGKLRLATTKLATVQTNSFGEDAYFKTCPVYSKRHHQPNPWVKFTENMRIEVRYRNSGHAGFNNAIWLMGQSNMDGSAVKWPTCGEIDIFENPRKKEAHFTLHSENYSASGGNAITSNITISDETKWNIYWVEILEDRIIGGINGFQYFEHIKGANGNNDWPWSDPSGYMLILSPGIGGWSQSLPVLANGEEAFMEVDWIRVYVNDKFNVGSQSGHTVQFYK